MTIEVRALAREDLAALSARLPAWSSLEYPRRLRAQEAGEMIQAVAWLDDEPVGRGMALFAGHEERSISAVREGCAEVRDVWVKPEHRRRGVARALMGSLEEAARERGETRMGLSVSLGEGAAPARALYEALGYRRAHGPYVTSATLRTDDGPTHVHAVLEYLVREL